MQKNISYPYKEFVERALAGGTMVATTLEQARSIALETNEPCVIKLLAQFDGKNRGSFLKFAVEVEARGIWIICGEAPFFEPQKAGVNDLDLIARPFTLH